MKPKLNRLAQACQPQPAAAPLLEALIVVKGIDAWLAVDSGMLAKIRSDDLAPNCSAAEAWGMVPAGVSMASRAKHLVLVIDESGGDDIVPVALEKAADGLLRPVFTPGQRKQIVELARVASTRH